MSTIYLIGSLRNPNIPIVANHLRAEAHDVYDEWYCTSEDADDWWRDYEIARGRTFLQALYGWHAKQVREMDKRHLDRATCGVLVMPAGKSGHLELGYLLGQGKPGYILLDKQPERFDVMLGFAKVVNNLPDLIIALETGT